MRVRTEAEIKAYVDGYNACYKQFCECLKNHTAEQAIKKMGVFVVVVNNCIEVAEQTEPQTGEFETMSCAECNHKPIGAEICEEPCHYEPQSERSE